MRTGKPFLVPDFASEFEKSYEEKHLVEIVFEKVKATGFDGKNGDLSPSVKGAVACAVAICQQEAARVAREESDKVLRLLERQADRQTQMLGIGLLAKACHAVEGFARREFIPIKDAKNISVPAQPEKRDSDGSNSFGEMWSRINKRGYFVLLTLLIGAIVAVWVTSETASWKSATEAARKERDATADTNTRLEGELNLLREEKARLEGETKNLNERLDVALANASTYRDRYNELAGRAAVTPDLKEVQAKLDTVTAQLASKSEELGRVQGQVQANKDGAEAYKRLYDRMVKERDDAKKEVRAIQSEKDRLQDELARLRAKVS